ncbi:hypothetical protein [Salmonella enterica]
MNRFIMADASACIGGRTCEGKNLLKPLRETAQAISNELGFTVRE